MTTSTACYWDVHQITLRLPFDSDRRTTATLLSCTRAPIEILRHRRFPACRLQQAKACRDANIQFIQYLSPSLDTSGWSVRGECDHVPVPGNFRLSSPLHGGVQSPSDIMRRLGFLGWESLFGSLHKSIESADNRNQCGMSRQQRRP